MINKKKLKDIQARARQNRHLKAYDFSERLGKILKMSVFGLVLLFSMFVAKR